MIKAECLLYYLINLTCLFDKRNIRVSSSINGAKTTYLVDANHSYAKVLEENEDEREKVVASYTYEMFGELIGESGTIKNDYLSLGEQFNKNLDQKTL